MNPAAGQMSFPEDLRMVLLLLAVAVPIGIAARLFFRFRLRGVSHALKDCAQWIRWPYYAMGAAFFLLFAAAEWHWHRPAFAGLFACFGLLQFVAMARSIWKHRSQWSINTLLVITFIVAVACSLLSWWGWPMVPVLLALSGGGILWLFLVALLKWWLLRPNH